MKWLERKVKSVWSTGPMGTYFAARKAGKRYRVEACWSSRMRPSGDVVWWSHDGDGNNNRWETKEAAIAWCERDALKAAV